MAGRAGAPTGIQRAAGPPSPFLAAATAAVVGGAALVAVSSFAGHVAGYVLSSFVTIGLLAAYTRIDIMRRTDTRYRPARLQRRLGPLVAAAGIAVASLHVWAIATELAG